MGWKSSDRAVERKTGIDDAPVLGRLVQEILDSKGLDGLPGRTGQGVDQIVVDMVGAELFQLGVQEGVHVLPALDQPCGQFGGDLDLFAVAILQGSAEQWFALAVMIRPGGVHVVNASVDGCADLGDCPFLVDFAVHHGQAHAPESQGGKFVAVFGHCSVKQSGSPRCAGFAAGFPGRIEWLHTTV